MNNPTYTFFSLVGIPLIAIVGMATVKSNGIPWNVFFPNKTKM